MDRNYRMIDRMTERKMDKWIYGWIIDRKTEITMERQMTGWMDG